MTKKSIVPKYQVGERVQNRKSKTPFTVDRVKRGFMGKPEYICISDKGGYKKFLEGEIESRRPFDAYKQNIAAKKKAAEKSVEFIVLAEDGNGGYEVQDFKNIDTPTVFHSEDAALKAIRDSAAHDELNLPGVAEGAEFTYFVAEIKRPVRVSVSRKINIKIK